MLRPRLLQGLGWPAGPPTAVRVASHRGLDRPVLVDHREGASGTPDALMAAGLDVQLTDLPVGDYVLGLALAVERKGPTDLGRVSQRGAGWAGIVDACLG
jgi:hypothetical protein